MNVSPTSAKRINDSNSDSSSSFILRPPETEGVSSTDSQKSSKINTMIVSPTLAKRINDSNSDFSSSFILRPPETEDRLNFNYLFDRLKNTVNNDEKVMLVDTKLVDRYASCNMTSSSEDQQHFKKEEVDSSNKANSDRPITHLVDEQMREATDEAFNTSSINESRKKKKKNIELEPVYKRPRMEIVPHNKECEIVSVPMSTKTKKREKNTNLRAKGRKNINNKKLVITTDKANDDGKTISPLPGLEIETAQMIVEPDTSIVMLDKLNNKYEGDCNDFGLAQNLLSESGQVNNSYKSNARSSSDSSIASIDKRRVVVLDRLDIHLPKSSNVGRHSDILKSPLQVKEIKKKFPPGLEIETAQMIVEPDTSIVMLDKLNNKYEGDCNDFGLTQNLLSESGQVNNSYKSNARSSSDSSIASIDKRRVVVLDRLDIHLPKSSNVGRHSDILKSPLQVKEIKKKFPLSCLGKDEEFSEYSESRRRTEEETERVHNATPSSDISNTSVDKNLVIVGDSRGMDISKSISIMGSCPITGHGDIDESPPKVKEIDRTISRQSLDTEEFSAQFIIDFYNKITNELNVLGRNERRTLSNRGVSSTDSQKSSKINTMIVSPTLAKRINDSNSDFSSSFILRPPETEDRLNFNYLFDRLKNTVNNDERVMLLDTKLVDRYASCNMTSSSEDEQHFKKEEVDSSNKANSDIPITHLVDEQMREATDEAFNTSSIIESRKKINLNIELEPVHKRPRMEIVPQNKECEIVSVPMSTKTKKREKNTNLRAKGRKNINNKKLVITTDKANDDGKTISPLPGLEIETAQMIVEPDTSIVMLDKLNNKYEGDCNDFGLTQNLLSESGQVNNSYNSNARSSSDSSITSTVVIVEDSSDMDISKSISTMGSCPITGHGDIDESPPEVKEIDRTISRRSLDLEEFTEDIIDFFNKITRDLNVSASCSSPKSQTKLDATTPSLGRNERRTLSNREQCSTINDVLSGVREKIDTTLHEIHLNTRNSLIYCLARFKADLDAERDRFKADLDAERDRLNKEMEASSARILSQSKERDDRLLENLRRNFVEIFRKENMKKRDLVKLLREDIEAGMTASDDDEND